MHSVLRGSLLLIVCSPFAVRPQSLKPLPTEFVNCVTNQRGVATASNKQRTPLVKSSVGNIAYGEVTAETSRGGSCQNNTTVYTAGSNGSFRPVLQQGVERIPDGSIYDGNGIAYLSWSPSGRNLLAVLFQWTYGTDAGGNYKYFVIGKEDNSANLIFPERAIWEKFKPPCNALISFNGWVDNQRIRLEVRPFVATDEEGKRDPTPACIKETTMFSFDIVTKAASRASPMGNRNNSPR